MIQNVTVTPFGRQATQALADAIQRAKAGVVLAPVTVVVPSNFAGLTARRLLGQGSVGLNGVANVSFVTPFRLAELLAAGLLPGLRPLTNPVLGAAVRKVLGTEPGHFGPVANHHATEAALAALSGELSNLSEAALSSVEAGGSPSVASTITFHRKVSKRIGGFQDEAATARAAATRPDLAAALALFGELILYLPGPSTPPLVGFLKAAVEAAPTAAIVGLTGAEDADRAVREVCGQLGIQAPAAPSFAPPTAGSIVSVTDADEEVRAVVRRVLALAEEGVPLARIGIFHPTPDPYVRILQQQLEAAGLPSNGPSRLRLADSVARRTLLGALALPAMRWRRDQVMALVSGGPLRNNGAPVRPSAWEKISRHAGVVQDLSDWKAKLSVHKAGLIHRHSEAETAGSEGLAGRLAGLIDDVVELGAFVDALAGAVAAIGGSSTWAAKTQAVTGLLHALLGQPNLHSNWPEQEQDSFQRVETAIARLAGLDEIEPNPSDKVFLRALTAELGIARGRVGRFGQGVMYGPLRSAVGHDLDAVFILGCVEGLCPAARRDDALLPDSARALASGQLELRLGQLGDRHREFLAALAAAPERRRTLVFARGDLRSGRRSRPSRWLLDSASALSGMNLFASDFEHVTPAVVEEVPSHSAGLLTAPVHATLEDRDLAAVHRFVASGGEAIQHLAVASVSRGIEAQMQRRGANFTEWDGNLSGSAIPSTEQQPLSPSKLEAWAACGFRYFLSSVLGLGDRDDPERTIQISPMDRGLGMHQVLEQFITEAIQAGPPAPNQPWSQQQHLRAAEIALEVFEQFESRGRTGRPVRWAMTKSDLLATIQQFLLADNQYRAATNSVPHKVEVPFGLNGAQPVSLRLPDGRILKFRGIADRVDLAAAASTNRGAMFVSDYKTGKGKQYKGIENEDPVQGGSTLQLGLYAEAAMQQLGATEVSAHYWMVNPEAHYSRHGYQWTDSRRDRLISVVGTIADGIAGGVFPVDPGDWNSFRGTHEQCTYCEFDSVCSRDRGEQALAMAGNPMLAVRDGLLEEGDSLLEEAQ